RVLVDDGAPDNRSLPYADARQSLADIAAHLFERLIEVSTHQLRRLDLNPFRDPAAHAYDGICDLRAIDDAAIADDRIIDLSLFDLRRWQIARACEDRRFSVKQIELRNLARQIQIRAIESTNRSDVFPVAIKH